MRAPHPTVPLLVVALCACTTTDDEIPRASDRTANARVVVVEERDGIWLDSAGSRRLLTATRVGGFDRDSLATKQREGEVILYWAAAPVLSPNGRVVAYATNREAVAADTSGQSMWLVDLGGRTERTLLHRPGHSYRPIGWLGGAVAYIGDEPGVWIIDPSSGERSNVSTGTWLAVAANGRALAVAENVPDDPVVRVVTTRDTLVVPPAPDGMVYLAQAAFDSAATRLLLVATPDSGRTRRRFVFELASGRLQRNK